MAIPTLQPAIRQTPPPTFEHMVVHEDNAALTFHESVTIPDIVPLVVNFNEDPSAHIGRAKLKWNQDEGRVFADIWMDTVVDDLTSPPVMMLGTQGSTVMDFEDVNYCMEGVVSAAVILTNGAARELGQNAQAEDETPPERAI